MFSTGTSSLQIYWLLQNVQSEYAILDYQRPFKRRRRRMIQRKSSQDKKDQSGRIVKLPSPDGTDHQKLYFVRTMISRQTYGPLVVSSQSLHWRLHRTETAKRTFSSLVKPAIHSHPVLTSRHNILLPTKVFIRKNKLSKSQRSSENNKMTALSSSQKPVSLL